MADPMAPNVARKRLAITAYDIVPAAHGRGGRGLRLGIERPRLTHG